MPDKLLLRKVRKGTRSCVECRQRKIKCIWASDGAETCKHCEARGRPCVSQVYSSASTEAIRLTSRERIGKLETIVSSLQASILRLESRLSLEHLEEVHISSDAPGDLAEDATDSDGLEESSPMQPSAHLQQLFDNSLLGTPQPDHTSSPPRKESHSPASYRAARKALQDLLPPKSDVAVMQPFVEFWIALVSTIFPSIAAFEVGYDMLGRYESMFADDVNPITIANYLCPLAICVLNIPAKMVEEQLTVVKDGASFVRQVSDAVEQFVFGDDQLMATLEGIDMAMMFMRLQMLRGRIRKVWLSLRRMVAMCEMIGVPKAALSPPDGGMFGSSERRQAAIDMWNCIISVDRLAGLMWGLPIGTASYRTSIPANLMTNGEVDLLKVLSRLSGSASRVVEIDEMVAAQRPLHEVSEKIMMADEEWRAMVDLTPPRWWHSPALSVDSVLLYWYQYVGVRIHIQLALRNDDQNTFAYSHMRCLEACRNMAIRYPMLRGALPIEFFVGRLLDIQALTPAIFLLHTHYRPGQLQQTGPESPATLVKSILDLTDEIGDKTGGLVAKQVGNAIKSVIAILESSVQGEARMMSLHVPTLGRIKVGARTQAPCTRTRSSTMPSIGSSSMLVAPPVYDTTLVAPDLDFANNLDWVMEISDDLNYGYDDVGGQDILSLGSFDAFET